LDRKRVDVYHHYSRDYDEEITKKTCAWCKGTGKVKNASAVSTWVDCDVCDRKGYNEFSGLVKSCHICHGSGVERTNIIGTPIKCPECGGKGYTPIN
jgi:DnaJ-class molecular chaperone